MPPLKNISVTKFVSGGQTGADRAALDWAIEHKFEHGGWCPLGRLAEDGPIDPKYELTETPTAEYAQRTEWNVRDSDGTVIFSIGSEAGRWFVDHLSPNGFQVRQALFAPLSIRNLGVNPSASASKTG